MYDIQDGGPKEKKTDRIAILRPIAGTKSVSSTGLVDPRLFKGENRLHIVKEEQTNMWFFRYDQGATPEPLKQKFTSFKMALAHATEYYKSRNVEIVEVID